VVAIYYCHYLHFFSGDGVERLCGFTGTFFGPGLPLTRVGRHFVLVMMIEQNYRRIILRKVQLPLFSRYARYGGNQTTILIHKIHSKSHPSLYFKSFRDFLQHPFPNSLQVYDSKFFVRDNDVVNKGNSK